MYEYNKTYDGLGALGWLYSGGSASQISGGRNVCFRPSEDLNWASRQGCRPAYGMGCRMPNGSVSRYPCCPEDNSKVLWECPPGWGTSGGTAPGGGTSASRSQVTALQQAIQAAGCNPGPIDGRWGPRTEAGLQCFVASAGIASVSRRFPWAMARIGTATTGGGGTSVQPREEDREEPEHAGGLPFRLPGPLGEWWFWVAAAGVVGLGVVGYTQLKKDEDEEPGRMF